MKITCLLPTINEEINVKLVIDKILSLNFKDIEIIVIDDNSTDSTRSVVQSLIKKDSRIRIIERNESGLTSAIICGIQESNGDIISWMDCDLSHPPELLSVMYNYIRYNNSDIVSASRMLPSSQDQTYDGTSLIWVQKALSKILSHVSRIVLSSKVTDYTSGFICIRKETLNEISFSGDYGEYFIELMYKATLLDKRIFEIPYISPKRVYGYSKTCTNFKELFSTGYKYITKIISLRVHSITS